MQTSKPLVVAVTSILALACAAVLFGALMPKHELAALGMAFVVMVAVGILLVLLFARQEKRLWHDGVCQDCSHPWRYIGTSPCGACGYKCGCQGNSLWFDFSNANRSQVRGTQ